MIKSFRNKALSDLWSNGTTAKLDQQMHKRIMRRLDVLDNAALANEMDLPGFRFHSLKGFDPTRYSVHVNGPWCITFEFEGGNAYRTDFEQYH